MKKTLLFILFGTFNIVSSQILQSEDFNSLTVGNIGANLTGTVSGQGGYFTYVASGGATSNFQIVAESSGNSFQITGSATASNARYMWKDGLSTAWSTRTAGNNIINIEFDLYTGGATTSKNVQGLYLYDSTGAKVLAGFSFVAETKTLLGVCYLDNAGTLGNYSLNLAATPVVLTSNTWVRIGMSFNKTTGLVTWKGPGFYGSYTGAALGTDPAEIDYVMLPGTSNVLAYTGKFDNLVARANNVENLLGASDFELNNLDLITLYPNPSYNVINLSSSNNIIFNTIQIVDINGRIIKSIDSNQTFVQIDVTDLNSGVYFVNIESEEGTTTKKFVKK